MYSVDIRINIASIKNYSASLDKSEKKKTLLLMIESFAHYVKNLYGVLIEEAINSRRYEGNWEPLDEDAYIEYLGITPKIHIIYLIKDALQVEKTGQNFLIRFNPDYMYPGTDLPLIDVLRAIEYGTSDFNSRPILVKCARKINKNISNLWRGYLTMKGVL